MRGGGGVDSSRKHLRRDNGDIRITHPKFSQIHRKDPAGEGEVTWTLVVLQRFPQRETHPVLPPQRLPDAVNLIEPLTLPKEVVGGRFEAESVLGNNPQTQEHRKLRDTHTSLVNLLDAETDILKSNGPALEVSLGKVSRSRHVLCKDEGLRVGGVESD